MEDYTFPSYNGPTASNFNTTCAMYSKYECATALDFRHHISFVEGGKVVLKTLPQNYTITSISTGKPAVTETTYGLYDLQLRGNNANLQDSFEYTVVDQFNNVSDEAKVDIDKSGYHLLNDFEYGIALLSTISTGYGTAALVTLFLMIL